MIFLQIPKIIAHFIIHLFGGYTKDEYAEIFEWKNELIREKDKLQLKCDEYEKENKELKAHPYIVYERNPTANPLKASITISEREHSTINLETSRNTIVNALGRRLYESPEFDQRIRVFEEYNPITLSYTYTGYL